MTQKLGETFAEALIELTQRGYRISFDKPPEMLIGPCLRIEIQRGMLHYARVVTDHELHRSWMGAEQLLNATLEMAHHEFVSHAEQPGPPKEPQ